MEKIFWTLLLCLSLSGGSWAGPVSGQGTWETTLQARDLNDDGNIDAFYDTELNITWLANADLLRGYDYYSAQVFASNLTVGNFSGWRLPNWVDTGTVGCNFSYAGTDCGFNVLTNFGEVVYSEMAHLFYVTLGNHGACDPILSVGFCYNDFRGGLSNTGNFLGMQWMEYSTGIPSPLPGGTGSIVFDMYNGNQYDSVWGRAAMFVHDGDLIPTTAVPEPETYALMLAGLVLVGAFTRRRISHWPNVKSKKYSLQT